MRLAIQYAMSNWAGTDDTVFFFVFFIAHSVACDFMVGPGGRSVFVVVGK